MRALDKRNALLDTAHWGQTAELELDTKEGKRKVRVADGPFIMFRDAVLKYSNGLYGWPRSTIDAFVEFMERWQSAIDTGANEMAQECQFESRGWAVAIMGPSVTPDDRYGDMFLYPFLPKGTSDKDKQKLME